MQVSLLFHFPVLKDTVLTRVVCGGKNGAGCAEAR
jgi:hypothetical protein